MSLSILLVKTSSLGDVIHTLPAVTDAYTAHPTLKLDWLVEESFAEIPRWHPAIRQVISIAYRRWRRHPFRAWQQGHWQRWWQALRRERYDLIIDAQGLVKSALMGRLAHGTLVGGNWRSSREPLAALCYQKHYALASRQSMHAINRTRQLLAQALDYPLPTSSVNYGIDATRLSTSDNTTANFDTPYLVFLHGTTWPSKQWLVAHWQALAQLATQQGWKIKLVWGNSIEQARAQHIAAVAPSAVEVLPALTLNQIAALLQGAAGIVAVDTGLGHLAAALNVPTISLYGPTNPRLIGTQGQYQQYLQATTGSMADILPQQVWQHLERIFN